MSSLKITPVETLITSKGVTEAPPKPGRHTTDVVYQEVRLYIEGVQVPFEAISINQAMGQLPTAEVQVPPQSGLMDICRYYEPKVHIFYKDLNLGGFRLLFWGHIIASSFMHSRAGSGSASIRFSAVHKNNLMSQLTLDYSGYVVDQNRGDTTQGANVTVNALNSQFSIIQALTGISGVQEDAADEISVNNEGVANADVTKLMKSHAEMLPRYTGMVSVGMNFWNQLKQAVYQNPRYNSIMDGMLIPMVENGIGFFKRMTGHTSLENLINEDRQQACLHGGTDSNLIIPPVLKVNLTSAVQAKLAVEVAHSALQFSGELASFPSLLQDFYYSVGYEVITLASPSEVPIDPEVVAEEGKAPKDGVMAVETIIKPQMPFYYSPVCNVIYPRMFSSVQVGQDESGIPTRVTATHDSLPGGPGTPGSNYRGPHSIREAIAYAAANSDDGSVVAVPDLQNTLSLSYNAPGKYEQGRGVRHMKIGLPWWLQIITSDENGKAGNNNSGQPPERDTTSYRHMVSMMAAWQARNGYDVVENGGEIRVTRNSEKDLLNPYSPKSGIYPHQTMLFTSVDYEFTKKMMSSRTGAVECIFNPYIVPGYPMDVLDDSPNHPSFHALCSSVTHNITSRSISTTVGMLAVQTYAELSNYYVPPAPPWLQSALKLISTEGEGGSDYASTEGIKVLNAGSLLYNDEGKEAADEYYQSVLGVRAADPSNLLDWSTGQVMPQARFKNGIANTLKTPRPTANGGDANDYNTSVGSLRLAARPIESKESIESKFSYSFVDLTPENYNGTVVADANPKLEQDRFLEPGSSPFLDYMETTDFIKACFSNKTGDVTSPSTAQAPQVDRRQGVN